MKHLKKYNESQLVTPMLTGSDLDKNFINTISISDKCVNICLNTINASTTNKFANVTKRIDDPMTPKQKEFKMLRIDFLNYDLGRGSHIVIYELRDEYFAVIIRCTKGKFILKRSKGSNRFLMVSIDGYDGLIEFLKSINYDELAFLT